MYDNSRMPEMRAGRYLLPRGQLPPSSMMPSYTPNLSQMRLARSPSSSERS